MGINESQIRCLEVAPDGQTVYAGTENAIYKSTDQGKNFREVFHPPASDSQINFLYIPSEQTNSIYAATNSGVYVSNDNGNTWKGLFTPHNTQERRCQTVFRDGNTIYIGTLGGLFIEKAPNSSWQRHEGLLSNKPVFFLVSDSQYLYAATDKEVYRWDKNGKNLEKIFSVITHEANGNGGIATSEDDVSVAVPQIRFMTRDAGEGILYLATRDGIFLSKDKGDHWQLLPTGGPDAQDVNGITALDSENILLSTTSHGIFVFTDNQWKALYRGLYTSSVNYLKADAHSNVYTATDKGIFFVTNGEALSLETNPTASVGDGQFQHEPTIQEVQAMAVEYAEVHPRKIEQWRHLANRKAWLPTVSVGLDRSASELLHWDTGGNPDTLLKGRDFLEWDVSLSWNLGELIWNNDQTSIDSRSKLMVELREDVLEQVTRLYFERRRLQVELLSTSAEEDNSRFDKEMRVAELTALIDALTGSAFSARMR